MSVLRRVLAVVAGAAISILVVMLSDGLVASLHPLPEGTDLSDPEAMRAAIGDLPVTAMLLLVLGWAVATAAGAYLAVRMTPDRWRPAGWIVTALLLLATVANLAMLPHPVWMWPAALVLIPLAGWLAIRAASGRAHATTEGVVP